MGSIPFKMVDILDSCREQRCVQKHRELPYQSRLHFLVLEILRIPFLNFSKYSRQEKRSAFHWKFNVLNLLVFYFPWFLGIFSAEFYATNFTTPQRKVRKWTSFKN